LTVAWISPGSLSLWHLFASPCRLVSLSSTFLLHSGCSFGFWEMEGHCFFWGVWGGSFFVRFWLGVRGCLFVGYFAGIRALVRISKLISTVFCISDSLNYCIQY
jgi:hypothetical protein